jgi:predicted nucleic acid-binding protein
LTILADTGAVFGALDQDDAWHERLRSWLATTNQTLLLPVTTLAEITYLLGSRVGPAAEERFVRGLVAREHLIEPLENEDCRRAADLMTAYADLPLGFVDATVVAVAERLGARELFTTDRRHFSVVRPAHCERLRLLP